MNTKSVWSVAEAVALLLGACSSGGSDTAAGAAESGSAESSGSSDVADVDFESPLGEFLGWSQGADFDEEAAQAEWAEKDRQVQEAVAACMAEKGFEYVPVDMAAQNAFFEEQLNDGLEWGSEGRAKFAAAKESSYSRGVAPLGLHTLILSGLTSSTNTRSIDSSGPPTTLFGSGLEDTKYE